MYPRHRSLLFDIIRGQSQSGSQPCPRYYDTIVEFWKAEDFSAAFTQFGSSMAEDLLTQKELADFWHLIEAECKKNAAVIVNLYRVLRKEKCWDDETLCQRLRISPQTLEDIKNRRMTDLGAVGLRMLYELFPHMAV